MNQAGENRPVVHTELITTGNKTKKKHGIRLTRWHRMSCIPHKRQPSPTILPRLTDPIANIRFMHLRLIRHPHKSRPGRFAHSFGARLDEGEAFRVAHLVVGLAKPGHGHVIDPGFGVRGAVGHGRDCESG